MSNFDINEKDIIKALRAKSDLAVPSEIFENKLKSQLENNMKNSKFLNIKFKWNYAFSMIFMLMFVGIAASGYLGFDKNFLNKSDKKINDWVYKQTDISEDFLGGLLFNQGASYNSKQLAMPESSALMDSDNLGFSAGGAKDINNFRENIRNGFLPLVTDITHEGLYYDYYFDTGKQDECKELFCPSYSFAKTPDPFSAKDEYYMTVGLNSGIKESDFERKKLNLVVVLDISGSMSSPFDQYYYDTFGNYVEREDWTDKTKMEIATDSIANMLDHLNEDDSLGVVLFDEVSYLGKPISKVGDTDMEAIKKEILKLQPQGGTNMQAGLEEAEQLFSDLKDMDPDEYENRIIFLTDAMPNTGYVGGDDLLEITEDNAEDKIYTTYIGVGVDFNTELVEKITKVKGANYYSIHSEEDFKKRLGDEFEFMVTPLVFDLRLKIESKSFEIEKVYGSPEADKATGEMLRVNTLFPSASEEGEVRGGVVLVKLKRLSTKSADLKISALYQNREGKNFDIEEEVEFPDNDSPYFDNTGIRKAILLTRYANLMQDWIKIEEMLSSKSRVPVPPIVDFYYQEGIPLPPEEYDYSEWERGSISLSVNGAYKELIKKFKNYFESEAKILEDNKLNTEVDLLEILTKD